MHRFSSSSVSFRFIYETEHFNGVAELLEILGRFVHISTHIQEHLFAALKGGILYSIYGPRINLE